MIIVHETFVCKPGNASKIAKLCKETMTDDPNVKEIMTDMTGQFNRVIIVTQFEDLAAYEQAFAQYKNPTPEMQEKMKKMEGFHDMYLTGGREIYQTW